MRLVNKESSCLFNTTCPIYVCLKFLDFKYRKPFFCNLGIFVVISCWSKQVLFFDLQRNTIITMDPILFVEGGLVVANASFYVGFNTHLKFVFR